MSARESLVEWYDWLLSELGRGPRDSSEMSDRELLGKTVVLAGVMHALCEAFVFDEALYQTLLS